MIVYLYNKFKTKKMKKYFLLSMAIFAFSACSDDDPAPVDPVDPVDPVSETINVTEIGRAHV